MKNNFNPTALEPDYHKRILTQFLKQPKQPTTSTPVGKNRVIRLVKQLIRVTCYLLHFFSYFIKQLSFAPVVRLAIFKFELCKHHSGALKPQTFQVARNNSRKLSRQNFGPLLRGLILDRLTRQQWVVSSLHLSHHKFVKK